MNYFTESSSDQEAAGTRIEHWSEQGLPEKQLVAPVQSVFSSVQGEGPFVGYPQLFARFAHCHLKCRYCDTPMQSKTGQCHWEQVPGSGEETLIENPMSVAALSQVLRTQWPKARHHSVSLTGGEPLLYHGFLEQLLPPLYQQGLRFYLETSATQPVFLQGVLPFIDTVAMDIKLPSATGEPPEYEHQAAFYRLARSSDAFLFIKLVFDETILPDELEAIRMIVHETDTPIFLQPVTRHDGSVICTPAALFDLIATLSQTFETVRTVPQTHKMLNIA
ncbi:MAG: 7-carboxy-7-deazaguanine synthase QueE [Vampirovibrionales bacterium]|nr:7-carboxy-7-deazaguanine synthase QueE [Vampirovibrionales bacterium]